MRFAGEGPNETWSDNSVARALVLSLVIHILLLSMVRLGQQTGVLKRSAVPAWMEENLKQRQKSAALEQKEKPPMVFVDVDPSQATAEAPKNTEFYSARNSQAVSAEPAPNLDWKLPKIDGTQDKVLQSLDKAVPLQTRLEPAKPEVVEEQKPAPKVVETAPPQPKTGAAPGDMAMAKPSPKPGPEKVEVPPEPQPQVHQRPRTLAAARQQKGLVTEKSKTDGGAKRFGLQPSFDAKGTTFGAYDEAVIDAIRNRWYDLLQDRDYVRNYSGKVVVEFHLTYDGHITDMKVAENEVSEVLALICRRAVEDPAPYARWPSDMRRLVGADYRHVRFTFYYN